MDCSSETSQSRDELDPAREALLGLRMFVRGLYRLLAGRLRAVPSKYLLVGVLVLGTLVVAAPWQVSSIGAALALAATLLIPEKLYGIASADDVVDRQPVEPGAG